MRRFLNDRYHSLQSPLAKGGARPPDALLQRFPEMSASSSRYGIIPPPPAGTSMLESGNPSLAALTYSTATASSNISVATVQGFSRGRILEPDSSSALHIPPIRTPPVYECPFDFLKCGRRYTSYEDWVQHSLSHFEGCQPPSHNECRFCDVICKSDHGQQSWEALLRHMEFHFKLGHDLRHARPPFNLFRYLWKEAIIDSVTFKELMGSPGSLSSANSTEQRSSSSYYSVVTNNNRRRRR